MSMRLRTLAAGLALAVTAAPAVASAQIVRIDSRADITESPFTVLMPQGLNGTLNPAVWSNANPVITGLITVTNGAPNSITAGSGWTGGFAVGDRLLWTGFPPGPGGATLDITFNRPIFAFASQAWYEAPVSNQPIVAQFMFDNNVLFAYNFLTGGGNGGGNNNQATVFGAESSNTAFNRVRLIGPSGGFAVNQWTVSLAQQQVVPEPATIALTAGGLALLGVAARRRRATA